MTGLVPQLLSLLLQKSPQWLAVEGHLEIGCALQSVSLVNKRDSFRTVSSLSFAVFQSSLDVILKRQRCQRNVALVWAGESPKVNTVHDGVRAGFCSVQNMHLYP